MKPRQRAFLYRAKSCKVFTLEDRKRSYDYDAFKPLLIFRRGFFNLKKHQYLYNVSHNEIEKSISKKFSLITIFCDVHTIPAIS
jgi:hypothetical protein